MATEDVTESKLLLAEYDRIKEEQKARIGFRDNLLYFTLAASTAVLAITVQTKRSQLLLVPPMICLVLGWTYLVNDEKISAIGRYIRDHLGPRLTELSDAPAPVFGWEAYHRSDVGRATRKRLQTAVDLFTYLVFPLANMIVFWNSASIHPPLLVVSIAETIALTVLAWQFLRYAER
ncbi:hypothetical protein [Kitasatospora cineracea]|uniref:Integral membrane protein n=1 Tax=Kitasatospora cineracea TaxID=88074 RepID=A0A8G1X9R2_9ACTN|nr:hypothetical protein [Kitasatospora cineracea]ROR42380.1 hypothetical protein EDD39_0496 [Kitasatospora cineracea]